jgi:sugar/nucleoside kinase (ribokinase family)
VITRGVDGATWTDGTRSVTMPAVAAEVVDTTGAGDAFAAGFMAAWDRGPEAALQAGTVLAARVVGAMSSRPDTGL